MIFRFPGVGLRVPALSSLLSRVIRVPTILSRCPFNNINIDNTCDIRIYVNDICINQNQKPDNSRETVQ